MLRLPPKPNICEFSLNEFLFPTAKSSKSGMGEKVLL